MCTTPQDDREDDADDEEYIVRQILGIACLADLVRASVRVFLISWKVF
jgi:hypothetical protein